MLNKELKQGGSVQDILQITIYFFQTQTLKIVQFWEDEKIRILAISLNLC